MRVLFVLILSMAVTSVAHGDARIDAHLGGGLEGGMISGRAHPTGVVEVGIAGEWLHRERRIGIGLSLETIARPGMDLAVVEEDKLDLLFRWARGPHRGGVGAGMRLMHMGADQPMLWGVDWIRLDVGTTFARMPTNVHPALAGVVSVDGYMSWTFGCYLGRTHEMVERPSTLRDVQCGDTLTTTYTAGLRLAFGNR